MAKKILLLIVSVAINCVIEAQHLELTEFQSAPNMLDAVINPKEDLNGDRCGLIKLWLVLPDATFDGNVISADYENGEWKIYLTKDTRWMIIKSKDYIPLSIEFPEPIQSNMTYIMKVNKIGIPFSNKGETDNKQVLRFNVTPKNAKVTVNDTVWEVTDGVARKLVNLGDYKYRIEAQGFHPKTGQVSLNDPDKKVIRSFSLKRNRGFNDFVMDGVNFVTLDFAYSVAPQTSYGVTIGSVKKIGWFATVASNFDFKGLSYQNTADEQGFVDYHVPFYTGETCNTRFSAIVGEMFKIGGPVYLRVGAGYGARVKSWYSSDMGWVRMTGNSHQGLDALAGMQLNLKGFTMSLDVVTTAFETLEAKLGLGYCWKKK